MSSILTLLARRWATVLTGLILTAAACVLVSSHVAPLYRATSQVLFLLPPQPADPQLRPVNPYLNLPEGMSTTANLIAGMLATDDVRRDFDARGLDAEYEVSFVPANGPMLAFTVTGDGSSVALATRDALMNLVDDDLAALQASAGTPDNQIMTASRPVVSETAEVVHAPVYRAVGAAGGLGLLVTLLMCLAVDRLESFRRRRARRQQASTVAESVAAAKARSRTSRGGPGLPGADLGLMPESPSGAKVPIPHATPAGPAQSSDAAPPRGPECECDEDERPALKPVVTATAAKTPRVANGSGGRARGRGRRGRAGSTRPDDAPRPAPHPLAG